MIAEKRNNFVIVSLILTFTIPLILAGLLYWYGPPLEGKTTNYGQLIQPTIPIKQLSLKDISNHELADKDILGKWILLTLNPNSCNKACETSLYNIRQIAKATGKDHTRLRQVVITVNGNKTDAHLETLLQRDYSLTKQWIIEKSQAELLNSEEGAIYFSDPLGNIMMRYKPSANPSYIFKDLTKLLKVSQIG